MEGVAGTPDGTFQARPSDQEPVWVLGSGLLSPVGCRNHPQTSGPPVIEAQAHGSAAPVAGGLCGLEGSVACPWLSINTWESQYLTQRPAAPSQVPGHQVLDVSKSPALCLTEGSSSLSSVAP